MSIENFDEKSLLDDETEQKPIYAMNVTEKEHYIVYGDDGLPNYYDRETDAWIPVKAFVSREDILNVKKDYPLPKLYPFRIISRILFPLVIGALSALIIYFILQAFNITLALGIYFAIGGSIAALDFLFHLGDLIILIVQIYQKKAPDEVRERCHLHPSCSFYCIYAIMKYGTFIGLIKAIRRLKRCEGQDEIDEP